MPASRIPAHVSKQKKRHRSRKRDNSLVAHYRCLGCKREWQTDLRLLQQARSTGALDSLYSGTDCTCGHPYIEWGNYDELVPKLNRD